MDPNSRSRRALALGALAALAASPAMARGRGGRGGGGRGGNGGGAGAGFGGLIGLGLLGLGARGWLNRLRKFALKPAAFLVFVRSLFDDPPGWADFCRRSGGF